MYKFLPFLFVGFLSAQQRCNLSFSNSSLSDEGKLIFTIKNVGVKKVKVPYQLGSIWARPTEIQMYDEDERAYRSTSYSFDGTHCLNSKLCFGKMMNLKREKSKTYEVNIIPGRISKALKEHKKYRFKLAFDTYIFSGCNDYLTGWLYYDNSK